MNKCEILSTTSPMIFSFFIYFYISIYRYIFNTLIMYFENHGCLLLTFIKLIIRMTQKFIYTVYKRLFYFHNQFFFFIFNL